MRPVRAEIERVGVFGETDGRLSLGGGIDFDIPMDDVAEGTWIERCISTLYKVEFTI